MTLLKIGCQTFTWEMLGPRFTGGPDDLLDAIAAGGYAGIEITDTMIGDYAGRPDAFASALDGAGSRWSPLPWAPTPASPCRAPQPTPTWRR